MKKIWKSLIAVCIVSGATFGAYQVSAMSGVAKVTTQKQEIVSPAPVEQKPTVIKDTGTQSNAKVENPVPSKPKPTPAENQLEDRINNEIAKGTMTEASENGVYDQKKMIVINKSIGVALEAYRISFDDISLSNGKYYVIADFSILNLSPTPHLGNLSSFFLTDTRSYSYQPTTLGVTNGDISGEIAQGKMKRGEIAFAVPAYDRYFKLQFETGLNNIKEISFKIDTSTLIPQDKLMPHE